MPSHDHRSAIHATQTGALRTVAALLAVVLLLAVAMTILDVLSTPHPVAAASGQHLQSRQPTTTIS